MTLIIAGHNFEAKTAFHSFKEDSQTKNSIEMRPNGLFALADSSITDPSSDGQKVILGGFRKIYPVPIKVWKPYFTGLYFRDYFSTHYESECFIAIAGSTLTAQHVLNSISTHLSKIRISYRRSDEFHKPGQYLIQRHCQRNELEIKAGIDQWDESMFTDNDYKNIITGDAIANIIEYSINESLNSAKQYKINPKEFKAMRTDFVAGIYCPSHNKHDLFAFRMKTRTNHEGVLEVFTEKEKIPENDLVILGMRERFEEQAKEVFKDSIKNGERVADKLFDFLNQAIDEVKSDGNFSIDRPSVHKEFIRGGLSTIQFKS